MTKYQLGQELPRRHTHPVPKFLSLYNHIPVYSLEVTIRPTFMIALVSYGFAAYVYISKLCIHT